MPAAARRKKGESMLKSKITRVIAGLLACAVTFISVMKVVGIYIDSQAFYNERMAQGDTEYYYYEMQDIYTKLWATGIMYLRNIDDKGKFKGTEFAEEQTITTLQKIGAMNEKGELEIDCPNGYEYYVSYGGKTFANTNLSFDELEGEYSVTRKNDDIYYKFSVPMAMYRTWDYTIYDFNWYTTNYGMTYYDIPGKGYAIFDFDTSDCPSYIDYQGAEIFYKLDGSTPVPDEAGNSEIAVGRGQYYNAGEYPDNDYYIYRNGEYIPADEEESSIYAYNSLYDEYVPIEVPMKYEENCIYIYDSEYGVLKKIDTPVFSQSQGAEAALTIAIRPDSETIAKLQNYENRYEDSMLKNVHKFTGIIAVWCIALALALYVLIAGGYSKKEKKFVMTFFDNIFTELSIIIIIAVISLSIFVFDDYYFLGDIVSFCEKYYTIDLVPVLYGAYSALAFGIILLMLNTIIIRIKCRKLIKTSLIYKILRAIYLAVKKVCRKISEKTIPKEMLKNDRFTRRFLIRTAGAIIIEMIAAIVCLNIPELIIFGIIDTFLIIGAYIYLGLADFAAIKRLNEHISALNEGNYFDRAELPNSPIYAQTVKLNHISAGIQSAVDRQLKSERMKIDLVTNVSHDLKTPLTSIISYIDLLSSEELSTVARDYVNIIETKSNHLKDMVADLFDLAKATSRTDVSLEQIDAVVLTEQVLGDMSDKIEASGRDIRKDIQADSAPVCADGKRMYRVCQNIIDNALKYSLDGTRIYVTLKNEDGNCCISVKNIASYEMTFDPDEITERFTRADESRTTDGNGLGLSIAKSFTEACGGSFFVTVDGDVFTAVIKLPLQVI